MPHIANAVAAYDERMTWSTSISTDRREQNRHGGGEIRAIAVEKHGNRLVHERVHHRSNPADAAPEIATIQPERKWMLSLTFPRP